MNRGSSSEDKKEGRILFPLSKLELQMAPGVRHLAIAVAVESLDRGGRGRRGEEGRGCVPRSVPTIRCPLRRPVSASVDADDQRYSPLKPVAGRAATKRSELERSEG